LKRGSDALWNGSANFRKALRKWHTDQAYGACRSLHYPYVIHYAVGQYEVVILRIIHGARRSPWE